MYLGLRIPKGCQDTVLINREHSGMDQFIRKCSQCSHSADNTPMISAAECSRGSLPNQGNRLYILSETISDHHVIVGSYLNPIERYIDKTE